eukprot:CAMPEP_0172762658 /NCGR_PEP_ID=MMETSP1074-20121228/173937_1 /TAXON_ID=2916 /ORGANISM="Ceratium fusus, Strain PA161109" /LENGTH=103 /DNA_ID=CAMNT_0013597097 /DNA_START=739 /DNA_END=1050 /DNA_ORIENTATION=-
MGWAAWQAMSPWTAGLQRPKKAEANLVQPHHVKHSIWQATPARLNQPQHRMRQAAGALAAPVEYKDHVQHDSSEQQDGTVRPSTSQPILPKQLASQGSWHTKA